ncbi:flagellar basal body P-ring protein FlgI, partial [Salipiger thiooxidans]|uniref:flagellar basal body P-ring protein FlgI n=1 Tax=Salipiger thiooxidans TaxID=282683 RepID=UPI001CFA3F01
ADDVQKSHVDHSGIPRCKLRRGEGHMGQISMEITRSPGSVLGGNQQVVDQRSGTIVMGEDVRISRVAVSQGNLTLRIEETPIAVQPSPFAEGETVVVPRTGAEIVEEPGIGLAEIPSGTSLSEVVAGLNALGVSPRDMIDILKSIKAAGALHAEFVVM